MVIQGGALALLVAGGGSFETALAATALLGLGTALVYPTLLAAVSDAVEPRDRASAVGVYRFWRDAGFVIGALLAGFVSEALGNAETIAVVAALTALSGLVVAATDFAYANRRYHQLPLGRWKRAA
jgi:MFS family permease